MQNLVADRAWDGHFRHWHGYHDKIRDGFHRLDRHLARVFVEGNPAVLVGRDEL